MPTLAAYGHSWVQGDGATVPGNRLVEVAARELGLQACNLGVGGTSSIETAALLAVRPPPAELYLLMTGLNDARLHGEDPAGLDAYTRALDIILGALGAVSPSSRVVAVEQPHLLDYSLHSPHDRGASDIVDRYNDRLRRSCAGRPDVAVIRIPG